MGNGKTAGIHQVALRMPVELHDEVVRAATEDQRSVQAQIRHAIKRHLAERQKAAA